MLVESIRIGSKDYLLDVPVLAIKTGPGNTATPVTIIFKQSRVKDGYQSVYAVNVEKNEVINLNQLSLTISDAIEAIESMYAKEVEKAKSAAASAIEDIEDRLQERLSRLEADKHDEFTKVDSWLGTFNKE